MQTNLGIEKEKYKVKSWFIRNSQFILNSRLGFGAESKILKPLLNFGSKLKFLNLCEILIKVLLGGRNPNEEGAGGAKLSCVYWVLPNCFSKCQMIFEKIRLNKEKSNCRIVFVVANRWTTLIWEERKMVEANTLVCGTLWHTVCCAAINNCFALRPNKWGVWCGAGGKVEQGFQQQFEKMQLFQFLYLQRFAPFQTVVGFAL